ncbi:BnaAnng22130D [Brassica napus]|uniref:BnaAnng22130D protein n=1 Tax=Brassica napus TaxID=3708 RepID=A0A078I4Q0_BRANA|nr:BnaC02g22600D [Brassica napus]CDY66363.1 BnaAnng22130D [Brassica napus]
MSGRDRSVIALGALDLLLVADCAWIWVKSKIRDPPEASKSRAVSLLLRRLAPAGLF